MTERDLVRRLVENHGAIVRTQNHIQVPSGEKYHDVWLAKSGLKWRMAGVSQTFIGCSDELFSMLGNYDPAETDLAWMQRLQRFLVMVESQANGVFVDAGWKAGQSRAALVRKRGKGDFDILVRCFAASNSTEAEERAIKLAQEAWPLETVHSDCQSVAAKMGAKYVPRNQNKVADRFGNKRGSK